jgi:hypothetical protein
MALRGSRGTQGSAPLWASLWAVARDACNLSAKTGDSVQPTRAAVLAGGKQDQIVGRAEVALAQLIEMEPTPRVLNFAHLLRRPRCTAQWCPPVVGAFPNR